MKSIAGATVAASCVISIAMLSSCGGGSQQSIPRLTITTASLPNGTAETPYSQTIQASGGVAPFTWSVSTGAPPHNLSLSSSTANSVTISGTPDTAAQAVAFTIRVADSASQSASQAYTVSILLEPDTLTLTPTTLSFAPQLVGSMSNSQAETVTNTGTSVVAISGIALTGTNAADFSQSGTCGSSLAAAANCTMNVTFTPGQLGPRSASITITDSTVGSPHSVALSGVGLTSGPNAILSATSLSFGTELVGTTSSVQSITLSNYGTTMLTIATIAATVNFGETADCIPSLASGASCTINLTFTPSTAGNLTGTLSVTDNAPGSPQTVALSGTGTSTGKCTIQGQQCAPTLPPCCPGLVCVPASTRAFCEPQSSGSAVGAGSSWEQAIADKLQ